MTGHSDDHGVPDNQSVDEPFFPDDGDGSGSNEPLPGVSREPTPVQKHGWWVENFKNVAALGIIVVCLIMVGVFAFFEFTHEGVGDGDSLGRASDVFKLIGTTALGYLFGRNNDNHR